MTGRSGIHAKPRWRKSGDNTPVPDRVYRKGDAHPTKQGWVFRGFRKAKNGSVRLAWASPEAESKHKAGCQKIWTRHYQEHKARMLEKTRNYRKDNPVKSRLTVIRSRCRKEGIPFDLDAGFFENVPLVCPVFGVTLTHRKQGNVTSDDVASIDRFIPALGYTKGNVDWMCYKANRLKSNATLDELVKIADYMRSFKPTILLHADTTEKRDKKDWAWRNIGRVKGKCKMLRLPFDLDVSFFDNVPATCPIFGCPLIRVEGRERPDNMASVDKLIPAVGYIRSNVAWISYRANRLKGNATLDELDKIIAYMRKHQSQNTTPAP